MNAPAAPRTPTMATTTAESRCAEVGTGNEESYAASAIVVLEGTASRASEEEEKKDVGRAMSTTPTREIKDAYCADFGNGSRKNR